MAKKKNHPNQGNLFGDISKPKDNYVDPMIMGRTQQPNGDRPPRFKSVSQPPEERPSPSDWLKEYVFNEYPIHPTRSDAFELLEIARSSGYILDEYSKPGENPLDVARRIQREVVDWVQSHQKEDYFVD